MEKAWWKESVIYQIYPRSFRDSNGDGIGDLPGITEKLDYLKELGVNVLWLSPVYRSPNDDNGYDISDYQAIMDEFGTMADFDELLAQAHARGLKIVMDLVVNHTSDEHPWFVESRRSKDSPKRDFYIWREGKDGKEPNNWGSSFSGPAWTFDEATGMYYLHCFSPKQPDLNWDNPEVRQAVFDMMTWWCEKGIDGFRMDVISMISKREGLPDVPTGGAPYGPCNLGCCNGPHVHEYLQEMRQKVLSHYDLLTVGECAGVTIDQAKQYANAQGTELNMVFQFEHVDLDGGDPAVGKWSTRKMDLVALKKLLSRWQDELDEVAWNSLYFCNHDQPRIVSRLGDDSPPVPRALGQEHRHLPPHDAGHPLRLPGRGAGHDQRPLPLYRGLPGPGVHQCLAGPLRPGRHAGGGADGRHRLQEPGQRPHPLPVGRLPQRRLYYRHSLDHGESQLC